MPTTHGSPTTDATPRALFMAPIQIRIIHCPRPGCQYAASAKTEGAAVRALAGHLVQVHVKEQQ